MKDIYSFDLWTTPRPVSNSLPTFHAQRGGISFPTYTPSRPDPDRQTGRTSKMLWAAACAKDEGLRVKIVVHDESMIRYCLTEPMKGAWWGLEITDFVTIENADRHARGSRDAFYVDHYVEELACQSGLVQKCLAELKQTLWISTAPWNVQSISGKNPYMVNP